MTKNCFILFAANINESNFFQSMAVIIFFEKAEKDWKIGCHMWFYSDLEEKLPYKILLENCVFGGKWKKKT